MLPQPLVTLLPPLTLFAEGPYRTWVCTDDRTHLLLWYCLHVHSDISEAYALTSLTCVNDQYIGSVQ